ncbi:MAG TPA: AbrB/MazE/SpoVT family DNA-binding domain-containing protein [Allosphingosinicella sp.]|jgi:AbrB family looped-hinge helix DNA binding protein
MTFHAKLINGGKVVIPADLRRKLNLQTGDVLVFEESAEGEIVLKSYRQVIREIQDEMSRFKRPGVSVVDDLIAERRREFDGEQAESRSAALVRK